jgi:hypothetical protein
METDNTRHSRTNVDPKTIDLTAETVSDAPGSAPDETINRDGDAPAAASATAGEPPYSAAEDAAGSQTWQPRQPARAERSSVSLIAAGLIGGVIAIGGAAGLQYWGILPSLSGEDANRLALNSMSGEIETLKSSVSTLQTAKPEVDLTPVNGKIDAIEKRLADVPKANGLSVDADQRLSALSAEIANLGKTFQETTKTDATARAELVMRLETLEKKAAEPGDDVGGAIAIASAGLKAAIDRGGPFAPELQTLSSVNPKDPSVVALTPYAANGVPSRAKLLSGYPAAADAVMAALTSDDPNQSIADRLLSSAFSAIKVRPVGNVAGDAPDAILARVEDRLTNGDLKAASEEWDKLPEAGKAAGKDFKQTLDARIKVEDLVSATLTKAVRGTENKG